MRKLTLLLAFAIALPCAAQTHLLKEITGRNLFKQAFSKDAHQLLQTQARQQFLRRANARQVQGKILLGSKPALSANMAAIERHIFASVPVREHAIGLLQEPTPEQMALAQRLYREVMGKFRAFKQESDPFLYYQSKPSERRTLTPTERGQWAEKISHMHSQLMRLKPFVSPDDPAYKAAREYVTFAAGVVSPFLRGTLLADKVERTDRTYDFEEFFLYTPKANKDALWKGVLPSSVRIKQTAGKLPQGLKMAVLNDRSSVVRRMKAMHEANRFFPGWKISYYRDTEEMLNAASVSPKSFDVILTDIIVPGGGGSYLTAMLRERGFEGVIIALAAFQEDASFGRKLFDIGFDGMIPQGMGFEFSDHWQLMIMKRLQNYFYYRDLHGWER